MTKTNYAKNKIFFSFKISNTFKDLCLSMLVFGVMLVIIFNPSLFSSGTIDGVKLFFFSVFPGLFPFMFLTKILTNIGFALKVSKKFEPVSRKIFGTCGVSFYAFFMSILSGYPIGAQIIGDLYSKNLITKNEARKMTLFCTTSGPVFVIGAVGVGMLHSFKLGAIIYISHIVSSFLIGVGFNFISKKDSEIASSFCYNKPHENNIFSKCLSESINSILLVGGYITIFYLLSELLITLGIFDALTNLLFPIASKLGFSKIEAQGILFGIVEITRGAKQLSNVFVIKLLPIISGLVSLSGISIIMQSMAFLKETKIKMHNFIFGKIVHSILSCFLCQILVIIFV